jgi:hypothetical protein
MTDWKYGDVVRRAMTKNPAFYQRVMYVGPGRLAPSRRQSVLHFIGIQLSEPPPLASGTWANPPPIGAIRPSLRRDLFEREPDDE